MTSIQTSTDSQALALPAAGPLSVVLQTLLKLTFLLLPVCIVLGIYGYFRAVAEERLREAIAETDRLDPGWRLEELEAKREVIPDDRNGALVVIAAHELYKQSGGRTSGPSSSLRPPRTSETPADFEKQMSQLTPVRQLPAALHYSLKVELQLDAAAVAEARRLKDFPQGRFPRPRHSRAAASVDAHFMVQAAAAIARLLQWDAVVRAEGMDPDGAVEDCIAIINAARAIGDEPWFNLQQVRNSIQTIAINTTERVLAQGQPAERRLAELQRELLRECDHPLLLCAMRGERASIDQTLENVATGSADRIGYIPIHKGRIPEREEAAMLLGGPLNGQRAEILRLNTALVEIEKRPLHEQAAASAVFLSKQTGNLVKPGSLPTLAGGLFSFWKPMIVSEQIRLRTLAVAVAVERHRARHGRWPESLAELTPDLIERLPVDPYDGNPLRYRRTADGVVVYSVGADYTDNNGDLAKRRQGPGRVPTGADIGIRLWDVNWRRQPAASASPKGS